MFNSIVVPLDLTENGDRALPVAASLSAIGRIPVTLLTVSSPGLPDEVDEYELNLRATKYGLAAATLVTLDGNDPAEAITRYMSSQDRTGLLVMATGARGPIGQRLLGSVSEAVLGRFAGPALLVGPSVPIGTRLWAPALVIAINDAAHAVEIGDVAGGWLRTFGGPEPTVVEVVETVAAVHGAQPVESARAHASAVAEQLASRDGGALVKVLDGGDPAGRLDQYAGTVPDSVLVTASRSWTDGRVHLHSTTRRLVHDSSRPVLVVPIGRPG